MKKLAVILLIGIYSTTVFGAGASSFLCCDNTILAQFIYSQQNTDTTTATSDDCGNMHHGAAITNHHIAGATSHFSARNYYSVQPHTGIAGFAVAPTIQAPLPGVRKGNTSMYKQAVPAYILHCVYRL